MTKLEEIAERLKAVALSDDGPTIDEDAYWLWMAREAIEALREPTEAMSGAGQWCKPFGAPEELFTPGRIIANACYRAMIDAILNEKPGA